MSEEEVDESLCEDKLLDWSDFDEDKYVKRRKRLIMLKFSMLEKSKLSQEDVDQVMGNNHRYNMQFIIISFRCSQTLI